MATTFPTHYKVPHCDKICIFIYFPSTSPPLFSPQMIFFFLRAGHLPPWHCSGRGKINKYVCKEAHDLSRCHRNMVRGWHLGIPRPCVCFPRFKHQEIMLGVSGEEYSLDRKTWQRSGMYICFAYYFVPQWHKCHCNTGIAGYTLLETTKMLSWLDLRFFLSVFNYYAKK